MTLEIVSPEATLFSGTVTSVTLPGVDGSFQILNNHAPIVAILGNGEVKIVADQFNFTKEEATHFVKLADKTYMLNINSGTVEMNNNNIIVLVD